MNRKSLTTLCFILLSASAVAQRGTITVFRVDGLIIPKARYDSLKIERQHILRVRSMPPAEAAATYGTRAGAGVAVITTSRMFVLKPASGAIQSASDPQQKETMLSVIDERQILRLRNINAAALQQRFGLANAQGAVVVELRD